MKSRFVSYIRKHPLIHRRSNTECPVRYNSDQKQHDERFPEREPEDTGNHIRHHNSRSDINDRNIEYPVRMCTFFRATKYIFVTTEIYSNYFHIILLLQLIRIIYIERLQIASPSRIRLINEIRRIRIINRELFSCRNISCSDDPPLSGVLIWFC